jgi:hypothetical protein
LIIVLPTFCRRFADVLPTFCRHFTNVPLFSFAKRAFVFTSLGSKTFSTVQLRQAILRQKNSEAFGISHQHM